MLKTSHLFYEAVPRMLFFLFICQTRITESHEAGLDRVYQGKHGDDSVENLLNLVDVDRVLEAGVANADDLVQVILDALLRPLGSDLGAEALEEAA